MSFMSEGRGGSGVRGACVCAGGCPGRKMFLRFSLSGSCPPHGAACGAGGAGKKGDSDQPLGSGPACTCPKTAFAMKKKGKIEWPCA
jgi:hypothetical protein